jgi:2-oxoglutarate ferredoxin oxidoreductase subunit beta
MSEALAKPGFSLVEVISPCPTGVGRRQQQRLGLDSMRYYRDRGVVTHDADVHRAGIELGGDIIEGKFVDVTKPTFLEFLEQGLEQTLGIKSGRGSANDGA